MDGTTPSRRGGGGVVRGTKATFAIEKLHKMEPRGWGWGGPWSVYHPLPPPWAETTFPTNSVCTGCDESDKLEQNIG